MLSDWTARFLHHLEQLIDGVNLLVIGLTKLLVSLKGFERIGEVAQLVMDQGQIEVDEREAWFDLCRGLVMETRQRKFAGIEVKIAQIVMRLDVPRLMLKRKRKIVERLPNIPE